MDLNAPIIIVPEEYVVEDHIGSDVSNCARSITTNNCRHLVVDAGHISVISQLGNKEAIKEIQAKRKLDYTDEDYRRLETMMYDKVSVRLKDAQVCGFLLPEYRDLRFRSSYLGTTSSRAWTPCRQNAMTSCIC